MNLLLTHLEKQKILLTEQCDKMTEPTLAIFTLGVSGLSNTKGYPF